MILYHLHNPAAPLYPCKCSKCNIDIGSEYFHCEICVSFDLCRYCYDNEHHEHEMHHMDGITFDKIFPSMSLIEILEILGHMSECSDTNCSSKNHRMEFVAYLDHIKQCKFKQCQSCSSYSRILNVHTMKCHDNNCLIPKCHSQRSINRARTVILSLSE